MAIVAAMRRSTQFAVEATPGAGGTTNKRFASFGLEGTMNVETGRVKPPGQTVDTGGWIAYEDSAFSIEGGILDYSEVIYPLSSVVKKVTPTTPGGATNARLWTFSPSQFASDPYQTYKIEIGDPGGANRGQTALNVAFNEWGFEHSSSETVVGMSGGALGGKLTDGTMTTAGVTQPDVDPILPQHAKIYYANSWANLEASPTEITNEFSCNFTISDRRALYRFGGVSDGSASGTVETVPSVEFELTLADESAPVDTFMTNARAGTKQFFRVEFEGATIETTLKKSLTLDICCVLGDGPSGGDEQEIWARTFPYVAAYDGTSGNIFEIRVQNTKTAL